MGITGNVKQISPTSLAELTGYPQNTSLFLRADYLPESPGLLGRSSWPQDWKSDSTANAERTFNKAKLSNLKRLELRDLFVAEWDIPALELDKNWEILTFLFAGYPPGLVSPWTAPDLLPQQDSQQNRFWSDLSRLFKSSEDNTFASFLVIKNSTWDGLPLVNAIGAGTNLGYETGYGAVRYLLPDEVAQILDGLVELGEAGVDRRLTRELEKEQICPQLDGLDRDDLFELAIDYYHETIDYYRDAVARNNAMLLYLL